MHNPKQTNFYNIPSESAETMLSYAYGDDFDQILFCVKCSQTGEVKDQRFSYSYIPVYAYVVLAINPLIGLLIMSIASAQHSISVPFCRMCWRRYKLASVISGLSILIFLLALAGGFMMMIQLESGYAFFALPFASLVLMIALFLVKRSATPRIKRADKTQVVVDGGKYGDIMFSNVTVATVRPV